jgi:CubicO group peptidase (beta-lactamase class C family)
VESPRERTAATVDAVTARRTSLSALALLGVVAVGACSPGDESGQAMVVPESRLTSAATSASTTDDEGFPQVPADLPTRGHDGTRFPGAEWEHADPAAMGFDPRLMRRIARAAKPSETTCLLVARKGKVVGEWNWEDFPRDQPREVFSMTKSVTSTLVGQAQAGGDLDIDDQAEKYVEEWRGTKSRDVTVRNILSNDSGRFWDPATDYGQLPQATDRTQFAIDLKQQYPPGKVWAYNNAAIQTLDRVISRATGQPTRDYAATRLFGPLGMAHTRMTADPAGGTNTFFGVQTTCEDMARFGYLFLHQGRWGDDQVVPRSWVTAAVGRPSQDHNAAYGLLWWINRSGPVIGPLATDAPGQPQPPVGRIIPGAAANVFTAQGLGGQTVLVDPGSKTVVVRIGQFTPGGADQYSARDAARFVTEALVRR